jgi:hypothetical protein
VGAAVAAAALQLIPLALYHAYMWKATGLLLPTSVTSRIDRSAADAGYLHIVWQVCLVNWRVLLLQTAAVAAAVRLVRDQSVSRSLSVPFVMVAAEPIAILLLAPLSSVRYLDAGIVFSIPLVAATLVRQLAAAHESRGLLDTVAACGAFAAFTGLLWLNPQIDGPPKVIALLAMLPAVAWLAVRWSLRVPSERARHAMLGGMAAVIVWFAFVHGSYGRRTTLANRLDPAFAARMNAMMRPGESVAMYEVELQYGIEHPVLSLDGIVGRGEFTPLAQGRESLEDALRHTKVRYIGVDGWALTSWMQRTSYRTLYERDATMRVGEFTDIGGIRFRKVLMDDGGVQRRMWHAIYRIDVF